MSVYCKIEHKDGRLSITGVEGPKANGDALGGCGQIVLHLTEPKGLDGYDPAPGWTLEKAREFLAVWDKWHLNDMKPYDEEMEAAGWAEKATHPMLGYAFTLTKKAYDALKNAEAAALRALREGEMFVPTPLQVADATRQLSYVVWQYANEKEPEPLEGYERERHTYGHNKGALKAPERKTLGWLNPREHRDGLLTRKLREDGPGYGSAWYKQDVPEDVLNFLRELPDTDTRPAWV